MKRLGLKEWLGVGGAVVIGMTVYYLVGLIISKG
jgi:hypothetical protein